ncbi:MAG TPA: SAM-dependent methyltransferase, partial [Candidatus Baltobacteraceae bacterium]|nr:SAM-dependent methyltransferase [Candidatus Baltobacteraceae bacterium]
MLVRIVGLGPGDPGYLTVGSIQALRESGRCIALLAPPDLTKALEEAGVTVVRDAVEDATVLVRGSAHAIEHLAELAGEGEHRRHRS